MATALAHSNRLRSMLVSILLLMPLGCNDDPRRAPPVARDGTIDLTGWSLEQDGPIDLRGGWRYYDEVLTEQRPPQATGTTVVMPSYLNQPVSAEDTAFDGTGHGTLHLRIVGLQPNPRAGMIGLALPFVYTSAKWTIQSSLGETLSTTTFQAGEVGESRDQSIPRLRPGIVAIRPGETIDVFLQVSNYDSAWIGPGDATTLGMHADLASRNRHQYIIQIVLLSLLVLTTINQIFLFAVRRKDKTALWFALFAAAMSGLLMVRFLNEELGLTGRPWFEFALRAPYVASDTVGIATLLFCQEILGTLPKRPMRLLVAAMLLLIGLHLFAPIHVLDGPGLMVFMAVVAGFTLLLVVALVKALRRELALEEKLLVLGITVLVATLAYDTLVAGGIVEPPYVAPYGVSILVLCQSVLLTVRSEYARQTAVYLSASLQEEVEIQTRDLAEKTRQAEEARAELEVLDREKTRFFQNISHELRTPLTLMLSPLDKLSVPESHQENLDLVQRNSRRLLRLVNQLLDFQKIRSTGPELTIEPIELMGFLRSCSHYFQVSCQQQHLSLTSHYNGMPIDEISQEVRVLGEVDALEKVLFNLLSNAFKFTPPGGFIRVEAMQEGDMVRIQVVDSGPGIAKKLQHRLFEEFSQANPSAQSHHEGTGLGLALVKQLTEAMGGTCGVESTETQGSTFWFTVPMTTEPIANEKTDHEVRDWLLEDMSRQPTPKDIDMSVVPSHSETTPPTSPLILIIDDLSDMRHLLGRMIEDMGYRSLKAANGLVGLHLAKHHQPDLILLDWMMPVMAGPELLTQLRKDASISGTPVIMLTARSDWESRLTGGQLGADAFLAKPFSERELESTVHNLLQLKQGEIQLRRANQALENFVGVASHDLRSPAATIESFAKLILSNLDEASAHPVQVPAEQIIKLSVRMQKLIEALQTYARSKNQILTFSTALLSECIHNAREQLQGAIDAKEAQITIGELPAVRCEPILLTEVFQNLIGNAIKYNESPSPSVMIDAERLGSQWCIRVLDNGIGIAPEYAGHIFEPFKRLHGSGRYEGSGLGLAFCREIIQHHGGRIWVDANPEGGSIFYLTLAAPTETLPS